MGAGYEPTKTEPSVCCVVDCAFKNYATNETTVPIGMQVKNNAVEKSDVKPAVKSVTLSEIASHLDLEYGGDGDFEITSLCYADEATENSLAVVYSEKEARETKAGAVLTAPRLVEKDNYIFSGFHNIGGVLVAVAKIMIEKNIYPDYTKRISQYLENTYMIGSRTKIGDGTDIGVFVSIGEDAVIGKNCRIEPNVFIGSGVEIGDNVTILSGSRIGVNAHYHYRELNRHLGFAGIGKLKIGENVQIGANTVIQRGTLSDTVIGKNTIIGNMVEIAHDVKIGEGCLIVSQVGICGRSVIGRGVEIYGQAGVSENVKIGDNAVVLAKSVVTKNIKANAKVSGMFARDHRETLKILAKLNRLEK